MGKLWSNGKELERRENNIHFAFHTCNVSWRCGMHKAQFATFIDYKQNNWMTYTEFPNGTVIVLDSKDFWIEGDIVMKKTKEQVIKTDTTELACFEAPNKNLACYDQELGNFVEFTYEWTCEAKACYKLLYDKPGRKTRGWQVPINS